MGFSMNLESIRKKCELIERASAYHHTKIYLPDKNEYANGFACKPEGMTEYHNKKEPNVNCQGLYNLDQNSWLTLNQYNALVLNTRNMLIADIDFGDGRLNRFAGVKDNWGVCENLNELRLLDHDLEGINHFRFADQTYRVYRTHSGCRVICTSLSIPWAQYGWVSQRFMQFLRGDPEYIRLCGLQNCYRARLTPKPWRATGESDCVCFLYSTEGPTAPVAPELEEQLRLHDDMTLGEVENSDLA